MIRFSCPVCRKVIQCPDEGAGRKARCPKCGQRLLIPPPVRTFDKTVLGEILPPTPPAPAPHAVPLTCNRCGRGFGRPSEQIGTGRPIVCPHCGRPQGRSLPTPGLAIWPPAHRTAQQADALDDLEVLSDCPDPDEDLAEEAGPDELERVPAGAKSARGRWWRPVSPSLLILSLFMFLLPWVEIRCSAGTQGGKVLMTQSGLQSVYGGQTLHPALEAERAKLEKLEAERERSTRRDWVGSNSSTSRRQQVWEDDPLARCAPLMGGYALLLLAGAVLGFCLRLRNARMLVVGIVTAVALLALLIQLALGFPAERRLHAVLTHSEVDRDEGTRLAAALAFDVRYTPWLWLGLLLDVAALCVVVGEWFATRANYRMDAWRGTG